MGYSALFPAGLQNINVWGLPDTTERHESGLPVFASDPYWGGAELVYCRANGTVAQNALVVLTPSLQTGGYRYDVVECPNTANLGRAVGVAMTSMTSGQFGWVLISGVVPIRATASVAADTTFGITGAGQIGANSAGKQILGGRVVAPATTTVVKTNCTASNNSTRLIVPNSDGWFAGVYLSGTGIAAGSVVTDIDPSGNIVTLSAVTTAQVNGSVTATYNNATVFFNVAHLSRAIAQGAIT